MPPASTIRSQPSAGQRDAERDGLSEPIDTEIPLPGQAAPGSQLAVRLRVSSCTVGVLSAESPDDARFSWEDECALVAIASQLGSTRRSGYPTSPTTSKRD
jgi:adenylate cyclase